MVEVARCPVCISWISSARLMAVFAYICGVQMSLIFACGRRAVVAIAAARCRSNMDEFSTCPSFIVLSVGLGVAIYAGVGRLNMGWRLT